MRLNISSNSRRKPNKSSNNLSAVYRLLMTPSSIEFRLTRGVVLPDSKAAAGGEAFFRPEGPGRRTYRRFKELRPSPLPLSEGDGGAFFRAEGPGGRAYQRFSELRASPLPLSEGYWRCQVKPRYGHDARR